MTLPHAEIADVVQNYLDGLHHSDTGRLARAFHPKAVYVCALEEPLQHLSMAEYLPIVDRRPSPASRGEARRDRIISIEVAGPVTAFVRLECAIGTKHFTDFLTLIRVDDRWQIISKVFHYDLIQPAT